MRLVEILWCKWCVENTSWYLVFDQHVNIFYVHLLDIQ